MGFLLMIAWSPSCLSIPFLQRFKLPKDLVQISSHSDVTFCQKDHIKGVVSHHKVYVFYTNMWSLSLRWSLKEGVSSGLKGGSLKGGSPVSYGRDRVSSGLLTEKSLERSLKGGSLKWSLQGGNFQWSLKGGLLKWPLEGGNLEWSLKGKESQVVSLRQSQVVSLRERESQVVSSDRNFKWSFKGGSPKWSLQGGISVV